MRSEFSRRQLELPDRGKIGLWGRGKGVLIGCAVIFVVLFLASGLVLYLFHPVLGVAIWVATVLGFYYWRLETQREQRREEQEAFRRIEILRASRIDEIDASRGGDLLERRLELLFRDLGYSVARTKATGDFGADLIASRDGEVVAVQAKSYARGSKVGIAAVQEVAASVRYYSATRGLVVTNSSFTRHAVALAEANGVELWDRGRLIAELGRSPSVSRDAEGASVPPK